MNNNKKPNLPKQKNIKSTLPDIMKDPIISMDIPYNGLDYSSKLTNDDHSTNPS